MIRGREMTGGKHAAIESALHKDAAVVDRYDAAQMATVDSERGKQWSRDAATFLTATVGIAARKRPQDRCPGAVSVSSGDRIRTCDLWVMS